MWHLRPFGTFYSEREHRISPRQRLSERPRGAFELATGSALRPQHDGHLRHLVLAVVDLWLGGRQRLHGRGIDGSWRNCWAISSQRRDQSWVNRPTAAFGPLLMAASSWQGSVDKFQKKVFSAHHSGIDWLLYFCCSKTRG